MAGRKWHRGAKKFGASSRCRVIHFIFIIVIFIRAVLYKHMIRGRGRRDNLLRNRHFLSKYQKFIRAGPTGHRSRRGGGNRRGGERRRRGRKGWCGQSKNRVVV
jgi:hypothetical protein